MVLGLIDFLLGGKRKSKLPKNAQATTPLNNVGNSGDGTPQTPDAGNLPDGANKPTDNTQPQFQDQSQNQEKQQGKEQDVSMSTSGSQQQENNPSPSQQMGQRRPMGDVITKIHEQLKETNERMTSVVGDIKTMQNDVSTIGHRLDDLEQAKKATDEKIGEIDTNMTKFLSLYELINNQYNPFVEKGSQENMNGEPLVIGADGNQTNGTTSSGEESSQTNPVDPSKLGEDSSLDIAKSITSGGKDLDSSLLELDTINIEAAAGDAVPLTKLKNNTNSLVIILSWLEYLVKKVGIEETRNTLNYYTDTLKWITPEVYFDLDKYLKGMKEKAPAAEGLSLSIRDHIVSLYFISKLNEKNLDPKLTRAVLQIIKE